jgi:hypothetical protein
LGVGRLRLPVITFIVMLLSHSKPYTGKAFIIPSSLQQAPLSIYYPRHSSRTSALHHQTRFLRGTLTCYSGGNGSYGLSPRQRMLSSFYRIQAQRRCKYAAGQHLNLSPTSNCKRLTDG